MRFIKYKYHFFAFGISIILCGLFYIRGVNVSIIADEIGTLASAPFLADFDWSYAVSHTKYYGFGYYWIFFILLKATDDYKIIYLTITSINFLFCCSLSILIYQLIIDLGMQNSIMASMVAGICTTFRLIKFGIANEYPVFIMVWLISWTIAKLYFTRDRYKINTLYTSILVILCIYSLTIHERMLALLFAICITIVIYRFIFNISFLNERLFTILAVVGFIVQRIGRGYVAERLWQIEQGEKISNMTVISSRNISALKSGDSIHAMMDCILTNLYKASLSSYGTVIMALIIGGISLGYAFKAKIKKQNLLTSVLNKGRDLSVLLIWVYGLTILIIIAGLSSKGATSISEGYLTGTQTYGYKSLFYERYYLPFIGPVFAATMCILINSSYDLKKHSKKVIIGYCLAFIYLCRFVLPHLSSFAYRVEYSPIFTRWWNDSTVEVQWFNVIVSFILFILFCFLLFRLSNKKKQLIFVILIMMVVIRKHSLTWGLCDGKILCDAAGASYEFIQKIQNSTKMPSEIYCKKDLYTFQFVLNRYTVMPGIPDVQEENVIFFAPENLSTQEELEGYYYTQLDENEYVYIKGEELILDVSQRYSVDLCGGN